MDFFPMDMFPLVPLHQYLSGAEGFHHIFSLYFGGICFIWGFLTIFSGGYGFSDTTPSDDKKMLRIAFYAWGVGLLSIFFGIYVVAPILIALAALIGFWIVREIVDAFYYAFVERDK